MLKSRLDLLSDALLDQLPELRTFWSFAKLLNNRFHCRCTVSYTHLRAHETKANLVCRLLLEKCKDATTVEAIIQQFGKTPESSQFWQLVEQRITEKVQSRLQHVLEVRTLLFDMH